MRILFLTLLALVFATPSHVRAQDGDPLLKELQKLLKEQGGRRRLQRDPKFRQSKARWPEYERVIGESIREQDRALAGPRDGVESSRMLYETRARTSDDPVNVYLHGRIQGLTGNLDVAYKSFRNAVEQDLYFYWAWDGLGVYHSFKQNWSEAMECFERALQIREDFVKAKEGLVQCYMEAGRFSSAVSYLKEILQHPDARPRSALEVDTRKRLAEAYRRQGDHPAAIEELTLLINRGERDRQIYAMRAWCNRKLERYADAARDCETLIELDPDDHRSHMQLASYYIKLGRNADAADSLEKALEVGADRLQPDSRAGIESDVERLRKLPARQKPDDKRRSPDDWIDRLLEDKDLENRREAMFALATMPRSLPDEQLFRRVIQAFARAIKDKDAVIRAKALQQVCWRLPVGEPRVFSVITILMDDVDPRVRGMACHQCRHYPEREVVPHLILALRKENDAYVVTRINETLNLKTLAWVKRVLPAEDEIEAKDIVALRRAWDDWYRRNRDVYRKHEPEGFNK